MEKLGYAFIHLYNRCRELIGKASPRRWKVAGITLVLLIAVVVGGFLFFNRDQAKLEKEQTLVSELNIILREREKHFETPDDFARVLEILSDNGYEADQLQLDGKRTLLWSRDDNRFVLAEENGDIVYPDGAPDDLSGHSLGDGATYVAPADQTDDLKWTQSGVQYYLTADISGDLIVKQPLVLNLGGHTVLGNLMIQHEAAESSQIENGLTAGLLVIDTPQATFTHDAAAQTLAVLSSAGYTENGVIYGSATVFSGNVQITQTARALLSIGTADGCTVTNDSDYAAAVGLDPKASEDPANSARAQAQAAQTAQQTLDALNAASMKSDTAGAQLLRDMSENNTLADSGYTVNQSTADGVTTWEVCEDATQKATRFAVESYSEDGYDASDVPVTAHTHLVERYEGDELLSIATGICTAGQANGTLTQALTYTDAEGLTTLLFTDQTGLETVSSGKISSIETHDVTVALGASQLPGVTVHFEDGTTLEDYPGLVWRSENTETATVLEGRISAEALGETEITVRAGLASAQVHTEVLPAAVGIDGNRYVSLSAALADAKPGDTVTLYADCSGENVTVTCPVTIVAAGYETGEISYPDTMVMNENMDTYSFNGRVTAHVYGAIDDPTAIVDDSVTGTLSEVINTLTSLDYTYNTLYFELYLSGDYALEEDVYLPARVASCTSFVITGDTTFDLNGHVIAQETVQTSGGSRPVFRVEAGTLTITDHKRTGQITACQSVAEVQPGASVQMENVNLSHNLAGAVQLITNNGNLSMENCKITTISDGVRAIQNGSGSQLSLKNTVMLSQNGTATIGGETNLTIDNCQFTGTDISLDAGDILVESATTDNGIYTVTGNLYVKNIDSTGRLRSENGSVEIEDATASGPVYAGNGLTIHTGRYSGLVFGYGETVIESGSFTAPVYFYGDTTVQNGSFTNSIYFYETGVILDGEYKGIVYSFEEDTQIEIQGGYFTSYVNAYGGAVDIYDGMFLYLSQEDGTMRIYGGAFRQNNFESYLVPGCTFTEGERDGKDVYIVS